MHQLLQKNTRQREQIFWDEQRKKRAYALLEHAAFDEPAVLMSNTAAGVLCAFRGDLKPMRQNLVLAHAARLKSQRPAFFKMARLKFTKSIEVACP